MPAYDNMTLIAAYQEVFKLWPAIIRIDDGRQSGPRGVYFKELSSIFDRVESGLGEDDVLVGMSWAIFKALHRQAVAAMAKGDQTILTCEIDEAAVLVDFQMPH